MEVFQTESSSNLAKFSSRKTKKPVPNKWRKLNKNVSKEKCLKRQLNGYQKIVNTPLLCMIRFIKGITAKASFIFGENLFMTKNYQPW